MTRWRLGDPVPIIVQQYVVATFTNKRNWKRSRWKRYSKLACEHVVCHGETARTVRQQVRSPFPITGQKIVCRRCTMEARRKAEREAKR